MTSKQCECGDEECGGSCSDSRGDSCGDSCNGSCSHNKGERLMEQPEIDEETKREIVEYQNLQQQIQVMMMQRQQTLAAIAELDKAKEEVEKSAGNGALYRFIGNVIVPKRKDELLGDLKDEKVGLESRRDVFQKQEERLRKRFDELQKKLQAKLGGPQSGGSGDSKPSASSGGAKPKGKKSGAGDGAIFS